MKNDELLVNELAKVFTIQWHYVSMLLIYLNSEHHIRATCGLDSKPIKRYLMQKCLIF